MTNFNVASFNMRAELEHKTPDKLWRSIDSCGTFMAIGDIKGLIIIVSIDLDSKDENNIFKVINQKRVSKREIESVKILLKRNIILYITNGCLEARTFPDVLPLSEKNIVLVKNCYLIALDDKRNDSICCACTGAKQIVFYTYNDEKKWFDEESSHTTIDETIKHLLFDSKYIIASLKQFYFIINKKTGTLDKISNYLAQNPVTLKLKHRWLGIIKDVGVLFDMNGKNALQDNFQFCSTSTKEIKGLCLNGNYVVLLRDNIISIYNSYNSCHMQDIKLPDTVSAKAISSLQEHLFILVDNKIKNDIFSQVLHCVRIPYDWQIDTLLKTGRVEEAKEIMHQTTTKGDSDKSEIFYLRSSWILLKNMKISLAMTYFQFAQFHPLDIAILCECNILPFLPKTAPRYIEQLVGEVCEKQAERDSKINELVNAIITLLQDKKSHFESKYNLETDSSKVLSFKIVDDSPNKEIIKGENWTLEQCISYTNTWILQMMIEYKKERKIIQEFFMKMKTKLKIEIDKFECWVAAKMIKKKGENINYIRAYTYEKLERFGDSLEIWADEIAALDANEYRKDPKDYLKEICRHIVNILCTAGKRTLIDKYAEIVLLKDKDEGMKIFTSEKAQKYDMPEDDIIAFLERVETKSDTGNLSEQYLRDLVKKRTDERYHTLLASIFIQKILSNQLSANSVAEYRKNLQEFLKTSKIYNPSKILDLIKNTNLLEEKILVYSKQKMHEEALNSQIDLCQKEITQDAPISFKKAEEYCLNQTENLLALLLEKLIKLYQNYRKETQTKQLSKEYKLYIVKFLKKYASNAKLDIEQTLKILPSNWKLKNLSSFFESIFADRISQEATTSFGSSISEVEFLNKEYLLMRKKKAYVQVSSEKICKVCKRKMAGTKAFAAYPNGIVVHQSCAKDSTVCPVTNVNFQKQIFL